MSFSWYGHFRGPPILEDLQAMFLRCDSRSRVVMGDAPRASAAGVELSWDEALGLRVRCLGFSSDEDYSLALEAVSRWSREGNVGKDYNAELVGLGAPIIVCRGEHTILWAEPFAERVVLTWGNLVSVLKKKLEWVDAFQAIVGEMSARERAATLKAAAKKSEVIYRTE